MSSVQLTTIVLNDADDPADFVVLSRMSSYRRKTTNAGRIEAVAGGRRRAIRSAGTFQDWTLTVNKATRSVCDWIERHVGQVVVVRDDAGHKLAAVYFDADLEEVPAPRTASFSLDLTEVTWTEALPS